MAAEEGRGGKEVKDSRTQHLYIDPGISSHEVALPVLPLGALRSEQQRPRPRRLTALNALLNALPLDLIPLRSLILSWFCLASP
jgi:hypothetical protein